MAVAVDEKGRQLYFVGWRTSPLERQLFRVSLDGGEPEQLTSEPGMHGVVIAPDFASFVDVWDNRLHPPSITVRNMAGEPQQVIHEAMPNDLDLRPPELHQCRTSDGVELYAAVYRPDSAPAEGQGGGRAPLIVEVYGGPGPQMVNDSWAQTVDLRAQWLARHGFVVLKVDNRGSARRGLGFEAPIARRMGQIEVHAQVEGVRWVRELQCRE